MAAVALRTITSGAPSLSVVAKSRPLSSGTPSVEKYRGPTTFALMTLASPDTMVLLSLDTWSCDASRPSTWMLSTRPVPPSSATRATVADSTPGSRSTRSTTWLVELPPLHARVAEQVDVERSGREPLDVDAGIDRPRGLQAADEESGGDQQQQRERDLRHDQPLLQIDPGAALAVERRRHP